MQAAGVAPDDEVHDVVALVVGELDDGFKLGDFGEEYRVSWREVAADFGEDVDGFLLPAVGDQPPGGVRHEEADDGDDEDGHDHEVEREAPSECVVCAADAEVDPVGDDDAEV